ncbi:hypothetical protein BKA61DRAFT_685419 [Leptodontidium sp. MPI-SDFR-AT-0119]|nr:hypothetical protein BKA61DRAFT_685419 [Leptodontidium sp. MPI-SDFR-AT-0119]
MDPMERRRRLSASSSSTLNSGQESESSPSSPSDPESNNDPESEPEHTAQRRRDLRWLHAGLYKDAKGATKDVWYAFKQNRRGQYKIIYASDWEGTSFGNKDVGRRKSDLITWDKHHSDKWSQYITAAGTWEYKWATIGRAVQRRTLLKTWRNPNSPNIYAHGKDRNRTLGPPLNVIHTTTNTLPGGIAPVASKVPPVKDEDLDPADCYPGSKIPFSTIRIAVGAYKNSDSDPHTVIANFLTSQLACQPRFKAHRTDHNDQIESAFYECGWRVNRRALERANNDMALGRIENAFQSKSWNLNPPLWVDRYKGDQLSLMLQQMREDMGEYRDTDESLDDESPESMTDFDSYADNDDLFLRNTAGPSKSIRKKDNIKQKGRSQKLSKKSTISRQRKIIEDVQDPSDDELDYLPEDSILKGKGPAQRKTVNKAVDKAMNKAAENFTSRPKKRIAENTNDEEEDDEADDEKLTITKSTKSTFDPGPTKKVKPDPAEPRIVVYLDDSDANSDVEIIEAKSTPVGVKAEDLPLYPNTTTKSWQTRTI